MELIAKFANKSLGLSLCLSLSLKLWPVTYKKTKICTIIQNKRNAGRTFVLNRWHRMFPYSCFCFHYETFCEFHMLSFLLLLSTMCYYYVLFASRLEPFIRTLINYHPLRWRCPVPILQPLKDPFRPP